MEISGRGLFVKGGGWGVAQENLCLGINNFTFPINAYTFIGMDITFDPAKDAANIAKHGVSLAQAENLLWDEALFKEDGRKDYGERRIQALIPLGDRLYTVIFTDRATTRRIISLRKSNQRELKTYVSQK